ncbi:hypothetical protein D3C84_1120740 [compost metagenome]
MKRRSRTSDLLRGEGTSTANAEAVKASRNKIKDERAVARMALRTPSVRSGLSTRINPVINSTRAASRLNSDQP